MDFCFKHKVVYHYKYLMWFSKPIIYCAIILMQVSLFVISHRAFNICPSAPMFQEQQASTRGFNQSTRLRAMSLGNQALQSTREYVMD